MPSPKFSSIRGVVFASDIDSNVEDTGTGRDIIRLFDKSSTMQGNPGRLSKVNDVYFTRKLMFAYTDCCLVVIRRADKQVFNFRLDRDGLYHYHTGSNASFDYIKNSILAEETAFPVSSQIQSGAAGAFEAV